MLQENEGHKSNIIQSPLLAFQTLSAPDLHDPEVSSLIAAKMREFHELDMPGPKTVILWDRLKYALFLTTYLMNRNYQIITFIVY